MKRTGDLLIQENSRKTARIISSEGNLLDLLADEIITRILSHLNETDCRRLRLVCQRLFLVINTSYFSLGIILDSEMEELVRVFSRYDKPIGLEFKGPYITEPKLKMIETLTHLTSLHTPGGSIGLEKLVNLQDLRASIDSNSKTALKHLTHLTRLCTSTLNHIPPSVQALSVFNLQLDTDATQLQKLHINQPDQLIFRHVPHLTSLSITCGLDRFWDLAPQQLTNLRKITTLGCGVDFSNAQLTNLTKLALAYTPTPLAANLESLVNLKYFKWLAIRMEALPALPKLARLEALVLNLMNIDKVHQLTAMTYLNQLQLEFSTGTCDVSLFKEFTNLTRLSLITPDIITNSQSVTHLSKLQHLVLRANSSNPHDCIETFTSLHRLQSLMVCHSCNVTGLTDLQSLEIWKDLRVRIDGLSTLKHLTFLRARSLEINWSDIENLTQLRHLILGDGDLTHFSKLTQLTSLRAARVKGFDTILLLTRLKNLEVNLGFFSSEQLAAINKKLVFAGIRLGFRYPDNK